MNFAEAIMQQAIAANDPNAQLAKDYITEQTSTMREATRAKQIETIGLIQSKLAKATEDKAPASVIGAYERMLGLYSK